MSYWKGQSFNTGNITVIDEVTRSETVSGNVIAIDVTFTFDGVYWGQLQLETGPLFRISSLTV